MDSVDEAIIYIKNGWKTVKYETIWNQLSSEYIKCFWHMYNREKIFPKDE